MKKALQDLRKLDNEVQLLSHCIAVLEWDQETNMPGLAVEERSQQIALLRGMEHAKITSDRMARCLDLLGAGSGNDEELSELGKTDLALIREVSRTHSRNIKLPGKLVEAIARQTSLCQATWVRARAESSFLRFAPVFEKLLDLILEKASYLGHVESPYDPLLDEYEPGMKASRLKTVFAALQSELVQLLDAVVDTGTEIDDSVLHRHYDIGKQKGFCTQLLDSMGYDFEAGRADVSAHPFTISLGESDVRLTLKYQTRNLAMGIFSAIHEGGHGLYEMGFGKGLAGSILANCASLGIHESQSRLWENIVGRSLHFWRSFFPRLMSCFPSTLGDVDAESFYRAVNRVEPSLIRIEADEMTYNLHIILRFNLELQMVEGNLRVADLPDAWRQESQKLLGVAADSDSDGVLQDIHWSMGVVGYFPTYCLGNLYAAQFFAKIKEEIPNLDHEVESGRLGPLAGWLKTNIHQHGSVYTAEQLIRRVTGADLNATEFVTYLKQKFGRIYGF